MTTPIAISENDLHTMLRIVNAPDGGDDGDALPWSTLWGLRSLIPSDHVGIVPFDDDDAEFFEQVAPADS